MLHTLFESTAKGFFRETRAWRGCELSSNMSSPTPCCDVDVGVSELVLADLIEDVVFTALGARALCPFLMQCLRDVGAVM